jgi:hypothetical protein
LLVTCPLLKLISHTKVIVIPTINIILIAHT